MSAHPVPQSADVLAEILVELRALRTAVEALSAPAIGAAEAALVREIRSHVGDALFTAAEVIEHARRVPALEQALVAALGGLNGRRLGHFLARAEGADCGGVAVARIVGEDRDGAIWAVRVLQAANPLPSAQTARRAV